MPKSLDSNVKSLGSDSESSAYSDLEDEEKDTTSSDESVALNEEETNVTVTGKSHEPASLHEGQTAPADFDEYQFDSSDEEDIRNTVGNIPMRWYDEFPHIGYDLDGKKIMKPSKRDELDEFLKNVGDPNYWITVKDKMTGQDVVLSDEDVDIIQRIEKGKYPDSTYNPYEPFSDIFSHEKMIHPLSNRPEHKRSFIPSKIEKEKVAKMVYAIKMGWIKPRVPKDESEKFYLLWDEDEKQDITKRMQHYIPAPKIKLPGHESSYNPPPEFLFTKEEEEIWNEQDQEERKLDFIPKKYSCLRSVPAYPSFIKERFERCLDLYLCPRQRKMRMNVDPNDLIPKLPKPKDLQPYPTTEAIVYEGHTDMIRCITVEPAGQFMASGSDDKTVKIWEVLTGRCIKTINVSGIVRNIAWCPNRGVSLIAVAIDNDVHLINPEVGDKLIANNTDTFIKGLSKEVDTEKKGPVEWKMTDKDLWRYGFRVSIKHTKQIKQVVWHEKGDYFATVLSSDNQPVMIHQLSKWRSQVPFTKTKGQVQCVLFHHLRPFFFVCTQTYVKIYNLIKQELVKKLLTNCKWVSCIALHSQGDNVIIGSYDSKLSWFDLDLSIKPYKTLRHHKKAIRQVAYHRRYPLFASASDDGSVIISHGMVYSDLLQNPLIVPVKILKSHKIVNDLGVLDCYFHPYHPWIFTSGADATVRLYT